MDIQGSSQQVAPSAGAITMLKYETETGAPVMLQATRSDGKPIPLGSEVLDDKGNYLAMVGQGDLIFARGLAPQGRLMVKWERSQSALLTAVPFTGQRSHHAGLPKSGCQVCGAVSLLTIAIPAPLRRCGTVF